MDANILIADDHEVVRHGLRDLLTSRLGRLTIGEARTAAETLSSLANQVWQLLLLDINLPDGSGLEVLKESRRLYPDLPVMVLTAYPEEQFAVRAFKLGAAAYLNKQSASEELIAAVKRVLAGGRYASFALAEKLASTLGVGLGQAPHEVLSERELQVLRFVALGKTVKEIAVTLGLSEKTIATYRTRLGEKTGLRSNVEIARYALKQGLVE